MESDLPRASTLTLTGFPAEVVDQINARFNPRCRLRVAIFRARLNARSLSRRPCRPRRWPMSASVIRSKIRRSVS
jgi:hypothetical protein